LPLSANAASHHSAGVEQSHRIFAVPDLTAEESMRLLRLVSLVSYRLVRAFVLSAAAISLFVHASPAAAAPTVGAPSVTPTILTAGNTPTVRVTVAIVTTSTQPALGVNLLRIDDGGVASIIGVLNDAGTDGDTLAGDSIYSGQFEIPLTAPGFLHLQATGAFKGVLLRIKSAVANVEVLPQAPRIPLTTADGFRRMKAEPDECYAGLGLNTIFTQPPCAPPSFPKVNQSYVWGMTAVGSEVWFGTVANGNCITQAGLALLGAPPPGYDLGSWACEFGMSPYVTAGLLPAAFGDFRPPRLYIYDTQTQALTDITPTSKFTPTGLDPIIMQTVGIRAAGSIGNLVLFGGTNLLGGINLFAFRADTHAYLGSITLKAYNQIRQFVQYGDSLYTAVGNTAGGGSVLKWAGIVTPRPCFTCFQFQVVGNVDGSAAYITVHQDHLVVTTWPTGVQGVLAAVYMSGRISDGLDPAVPWKKLWDASNYEPDPLVAASYAGGAIASFNGSLYFGTLHIPWLATGIFASVFPPTDPLSSLQALGGTFRTAVLFRLTDLDNAPGSVELLYGSETLPAFVFGSWVNVPNNMHQTPRFGPAGFGNSFNNYIWSMAVWNNRLWVGTMDWSFPAQQGGGGEALWGFTTTPDQNALINPQVFGGDLYSFGPDSELPAVQESIDGVGNYTSYGIRNMVVSGNLFLGMANPMNLLTAPNAPNGGWELIEVKPKNN
jgi:hypothetical protein